MRNMINRIASVALTVLLVCCILFLVPGFSKDTNAATTVATFTVSDTITATLDSDGLLTVTGTGAIPAKSFVTNTYKNSVKTVFVGNGITSIGRNSFGGLSNLTSVTGMEDVTKIDEYAFSNSSITDFYIGRSLTEIKTFTYGAGRAQGFVRYTVSPDNPYFSASGGILFDHDKTTLIAYPILRTTTSYTIPSTVTTIAASAFRYQPYLKTVNLSGVVSIGEYAFSDMSSLKNIKVPAGATEIGKCAFAYNPSLETFDYDVQFGPGVVLTLPTNICYGCTSLRTVDFTDSNVCIIGNSAFAGCTSLNSVLFNDCITTIQGSAFKNCSSLLTLDFPNTICDLFEGAFEGTGITTDMYPSWMCDTCTSSKKWIKGHIVDLSGTYCYDLAYQVVELLNSERVAEGLEPLEIDDRLMNYSMTRAPELAVLFGHFRPYGALAPSDTIISSSWMTEYLSEGENAAMGQMSAEAVFESWMNSPGHHDNMLNSKWKTIGVGCFSYNGMLYWVQNFSRHESVGNTHRQDSEEAAHVLVLYTYFRGMVVGGQPKNPLEVGQECTLVPAINRATIGTSLWLCDVSNYTFTSSDPSVVSVDPDGTIHALKKGTATITVSMYKYNCVDISETVDVTVRQDDINGANITVDPINDCTYNCGNPLKPNVIIRDNGVRISSKYYDLEYISNINVGTATVRITGKGYYFGTREVTFNILQKDIHSCYFYGIPMNKTVVYSGDPVSLDIIIYSYDTRQNPLRENVDYTVSYSGDRVNVGKFQITFTGKGGYVGSKTFEIRISSLSFNNLDMSVTGVKASADCPGYPDISGIIVKANGKKLVEKQDFICVISSDSNGYNILVWGRGNYTGEYRVLYNSETEELTTPTPTPVPTGTSATPTPVSGQGGTVSPTPSPQGSVVTITPTAVPASSGTTPVPAAAPGADPADQRNSGVADFIERLYTVALGRASDGNGKADWINRVRTQGYTGADLARGFLFSDEFLSKQMSNSEFLDIMYATFFDRQADDQKAYWMGLFDQGWTKMQIIDGFIDSTEWANLCLTYGIASGTDCPPNIIIEPSPEVVAFATRLYTTCLGRSADTRGLEDWSGQLANMQISGSAAAHGFFFSDEFITGDYSNDEYVTRLYRTFMGREPDPAGFADWTGQLAAGATRESVFQGFAGSSEWAGICAEYGILK